MCTATPTRWATSGYARLRTGTRPAGGSGQRGHRQLRRRADHLSPRTRRMGRPDRPAACPARAQRRHFKRKRAHLGSPMARLARLGATRRPWAGCTPSRRRPGTWPRCNSRRRLRQVDNRAGPDQRKHGDSCDNPTSRSAVAGSWRGRCRSITARPASVQPAASPAAVSGSPFHEPIGASEPSSPTAQPNTHRAPVSMAYRNRRRG